MHASQLIGLLKILEEQELKRLDKFLKSDYYNKVQADKVLQLFEYLKKYAPDYPAVSLKREKVHFHLFKKEEVSNLKLNKLIHFLKQLIEEFLIMIEQERQPYLKEKLLLQSLKRRHHISFRKRNEKLMKAIGQDRKQLLKTENHLHLFELNIAQWSDINTEKIANKNTQLSVSNQHLDAFYLQQKLNIFLEIESYKNIVADEYESGQYLEIINLTKNFLAQQEHLSLKLLLATVELFNTEDENDYFEIKQLFFDEIGQISRIQARNIWLALNNFYISRNGKIKGFNVSEGFDLYQFADQYNLLVEDNRIRDTEYTNGAIVGFASKNSEWAHIFTEKYKAHLIDEKQKPNYAYVKAFYFFQQQAFDVVTDLLFPIEESEKQTLHIHIRIRSLNCRAHFELWEQQNYPFEGIKFLGSIFYNFNRYMERNKTLSNNRKEDYFNFVKNVRKILKAYESNSLQLSKLQRIQKGLNALKPNTLNSWVIRKVNRMIEYLSN